MAVEPALGIVFSSEIAWRQLSDDDWVAFRVFVMAPATGLFMLAQLPLTLYGLRVNENDLLAAQLSDSQHSEAQEELPESHDQH